MGLSRGGGGLPDPDDDHTPSVVDAGGRWILPISSREEEQLGEVDQLRIDYAFTVVISALLEIRIETEFTLTRDGVVTRFEPEDTASLASLLCLHKAVVQSATVSKAGVVRVEFADGRVLTVEPHDQYESCAVHVRRPRGGKWFDLFVPPGGLAESDFGAAR